MKYRLLCIDVDGTLLNDNKKLSKQDVEAIKRASEQGIKVAIVTGRMPAATEFIVRKLQVPCILACNAGTCIVEDKQCISVECMPVPAMRMLYKTVEKSGIPLWIFRERQWFVTEMDEYIQKEINTVHCIPEIVDIDILAQKWEKEKTGPNKVLICTRPDMIQEIYRELRKEDRQDIDMACSAETFLEIFPKGVNKGKALKLICEKLGIRQEEVIAFGDQELDIPMLQAAGMGVAMGNAIDELKQRADFITKTNNEAGIAYALDYFLKKGV